MAGSARFRRLRSVGLLAVCWLLCGLLPPVDASAASEAATPAAAPGAAPAPFTVPLTSRERHGLKPGEQAPVEPPRLAVQDQLSGPASLLPRGGGGGGGGGVPPATNLFLLPGLAIDDTSFELFFDAPDTGWAQGIVELSPAGDPGTVLHRASFAFADLQRTPCDSPARLCVTLRNADGWTLDAFKRFAVTVTLAAADGTQSTSARSAAETPRQLPVPPPVPGGGLRGGSGTGSTGRTVRPVLRGFGVNTATGAFTQYGLDAVMRSSFPINVSAERSYSSEDSTTGLLGAGWAFSYEARVFRKPDAPGQVVFRAEDGTETTYTQKPDGSYQAPAGVLSQLSAVSGGGWQVTTHDQRKLSFDAGGRLLSILDPRGKGVTLSYDAAGLSRVTDAGGRQLEIELQDGRLSRLELPDGREVRYRYTNNRLTGVRNPDGAETAYAYDAQGRLSRVTDALGHLQVEVGYDPGTGRVSTQKDNLGKVTSFAWDGAAQVSRVTDPDGVVTTDHFLGNVLVDSVNGNADVTVFRYDSQLNGQVLADPLRHQIDMGFDGHGNATSSTLFGANPATEPNNVGLTESATFDADNNLLSATDGRQKTATFTYNQFNQPVTSTDREGNTGKFDYFPETGLLHTLTDPLGHVTTFAYDRAGNRISRTDPVGAVTTFRYDGTGRLISTTDPRGNVKREEDEDREDRPFTTRSRYDGEDRLIRVTDALRHTREARFDAAGRLRSSETGTGPRPGSSTTTPTSC